MIERRCKKRHWPPIAIRQSISGILLVAIYHDEVVVRGLLQLLKRRTSYSSNICVRLPIVLKHRKPILDEYEPAVTIPSGIRSPNPCLITVENRVDVESLAGSLRLEQGPRFNQRG